MATVDTPSLNTLYFYICDICNLRCQHCWISPMLKKRGYRPQVSIEEYIQFVEQALPLGLSYVKITGGEPLLREDLWEFLEYLSRRGIATGIETNGTLITEDNAQFFVQMKTKISISLDAADPKIHDDLRGVVGAYKRTLRGIERLRKYGNDVYIVMALYKHNLFQIKPLFDLCQHLGVKAVKINPIVPLGRGEQLEADGSLLHIKEILDLVHYVQEDLDSSYDFRAAIHLPCAFLPLSKIGDSPQCPFKNLLSVLANGNISFCGLGYSAQDWKMGNIKDTNLRTLWETNETLNYIREKLPGCLEGVCQICLMKKFCGGGCRALAFSQYGSFTAPSPFCQALYKNGLFPVTRLIGDCH